MIPLLSLMIGAYICTRMLVLALRDDPHESKSATTIIRLVAIATIVITIFCVGSIFMTGLGMDLPSF